MNTKGISQQACSTSQEVSLCGTELFGPQISAHTSCSWAVPWVVSSYDLNHHQGNICVRLFYSASFRELGITEKLLLKDSCSHSAAGMAKGLGVCCLFFPFIHTQKNYLRRLVILEEILGLQLGMFRRYSYLCWYVQTKWLHKYLC